MTSKNSLKSDSSISFVECLVLFSHSIKLNFCGLCLCGFSKKDSAKKRPLEKSRGLFCCSKRLLTYENIFIGLF